MNQDTNMNTQSEAADKAYVIALASRALAATVADHEFAELQLAEEATFFFYNFPAHITPSVEEVYAAFELLLHQSHTALQESEELATGIRHVLDA